jgi:hypothetical protein
LADLVLLCGIPTEGPIALVRRRLDDLGVPYVMVSQRAFEDTPFSYAIRNAGISGRLSVAGTDYPLEDVRAVYTRLMDPQALPELAGEPAGSARRVRAAAWHDVLSEWLAIAPIRVVNRAAAMASNGSKPFQAQAILRQGLHIPETLITSDPALAREFARQLGRVIFKSMSGVRSIVREMEADDLARLHQIRWCPVQFQTYVPGQNVRVHTIGAQVFASRIISDATDYRYAARQTGEPADLEPFELSDELAERCLALAADLDLPFAGIDLKITPDGEVYCFEVNPSPAYSYYESQTGQPVSLALAQYLAGS